MVHLLLPLIVAFASGGVVDIEPATLEREGPVRKASDSVVRVRLNSLRDVRTMESLSGDMWSHGIYGGEADYQVSPEQLAALTRTKLEYCVMIENLDDLVQAEAKRLAAPPAEGGVADDAWFSDFKDLAAINARLYALKDARPDIASIVVVGTSVEGRPILGLRISAAPAGTSVPGIVFNATQHAREWGAAMTGMFLADRLVESADTDPRVHALLSRAEIFVIPVVNPDGYFFTWSDSANRLWRKNRRNNGDGTFGVDNNRNWGYEWGGAGASTQTSSETYRGTGPFSEPETAAMRDFFNARPNIVSNIDFHSYSQLVLSPWAYTVAPSVDAVLFQSIGDAMKNAIFAETGAAFIAGPVGSTLYLASGGSVDWVYGARGALAWTIEVRDKGTYGFVMPPAEILPCARECFAAALTMAEATAQAVILTLPTGAPTRLVSNQATPIAVLIRQIVPGAVVDRRLFSRINAGSWQSTPLVFVSGDVYNGMIPAASCGAVVDFYIEVTLTSGSPVRYPTSAPNTFLSATVSSEIILSEYDFEVANSGWIYGVVGDTATGGAWIRGDPIATTAQSEDDHTPGTATQCAFTGQGTVGGTAGNADVDNGITTLQSPILGTMVPGAHLRYWFWYTNNLGGSPNLDEFVVQVSGDGIVWTTATTVQSSATLWREADITLNGLLAVGSAIRVRFIAQDLGAGSLVEAAIDDVKIVNIGCSSVIGDINGDGLVNGFDLATLLSQWGGPGSGDLNGDQIVGGSDLAFLLSNWG